MVSITLQPLGLGLFTASFTLQPVGLGLFTAPSPIVPSLHLLKTSIFKFFKPLVSFSYAT